MTTPGSLVRPPRTVDRLRMAAVCAALVAVSVMQDPGDIIADTKIDLTVDPGQFLSRALHLWDPSVSFGQVSNQADGYLWPMGPFFLGGTWLGVPPWLLERLWWALLMCVAFTGVVALARRLAIGTPASRMLAGVAFALSPRILSEIGANSIEAWPMAMAPWVLVPLVALAHGGRLRRAVTWSALAVACAGGVNATAVFAVVPLAVIWLLMLHPLRLRLTALVAWSAAVACATAWWVVPLLVLGRYAPPFLNYTETAVVTTRVTDAVSVLRGASHWLTYLNTPFGPAWTAGFALATQPVLIAATLVVAGLGVLGLSRRGVPHRGFLVTGVVVGVALVSLGHVSELAGTLASAQADFLDGIGAPLRNAHKFDLVLRLPLALGLAHAVGSVGRLNAVARRGSRPVWVATGLFTGASVAAVLALVSPVAFVGLAPVGGFAAVPQYWRDAGSWLDEHAGPDRVLVIPGASFPNYTWGTTGDEIAQPLLHTPWAVRNAIPLAPANTIRLLDAVESVLSTGNGSPGLADLLARSGVRYLLVRSDLDYGRTASTRPVIVEQALQRSIGLSRVAEFGPMVGADRADDVVLDHGLNVPTRALQIYQIDRQVDPVATYDLSDVTTVVGGPESLLDLAAAGQLSGAPTILAGDLPGSAPGSVAITDGLRRREVAFGQLHDNTTATLTRDQPFEADVPAHDYLPPWGANQLTTVRYQGISDVTASSSAAQADAFGGSRPQYQPFAALDGDLTTAWRTAPGTAPTGQWFDIQLAEPRTVDEVRLVFDVAAWAVPSKVTVTAGAESATASGLGPEMDIRLPGVHATRRIRITVDDVVTVGGQTGDAGPFGITEIGIPSLVTSRTLVTATPPGTGTPGPIVLTAAPSTPACFFVDEEARCGPAAQRASEDGPTIDRTVTLRTDATYLPTLWARPRPGQSLNTVLDGEVAASNPLKIAPGVSASTNAVPDPVGRPGVVIDGDPGTVWSPAATDPNPLLHLTWLAPRVITGIRLTLPAATAASPPGAVQVIGDDGVRGGFPDATGLVQFDRPMHTDEITVLFVQPPRLKTKDAYTGATEVLPIGVGELTVLPALDGVPLDLDRAVTLPCGSGPTLTAGTTTIRTRIVATRRDLLQLREVPAQPCGTGAEGAIALPAGEDRVTLAASPLATPTRLALAPDEATTATATAVRMGTWSPTLRQAHLDPRAVDRVLVVHENTNSGWQATVAGRTLEPIVLDGWQQGWIVPAGVSGEVTLRFGPDTTFRDGLAVGAALLLGLVVIAVIPPRRRGWHVRTPERAPVRRTGRLATLAIGGAALVLVGGVFGGLVVLAGIIAAYYRSVFPSSTLRHRQGMRTLRALELWLPLGLLAYGGWLSAHDSWHRALAVQLAGLLCVGVLWLSVLAQPVGSPARGTTHQRPLQGVEADRREHQRNHHSQHEDRDGIAAEVGSVFDQVDGLQHKRMPQEESV